MNSKPFFGNEKYLLMMEKRRSVSQMRVARKGQSLDAFDPKNTSTNRPVDLLLDTAADW